MPLNICVEASKDVVDGFFKYLNSRYKWEQSGFSIDWTVVNNSKVIDCTHFSFEEIANTLRETCLSRYNKFCFAYTSESTPVLCEATYALNNISDLLIGPGDALIIGVDDNDNCIYEDFVEIYAGNWISWGKSQE
jgi:hypothetical protein